MTAAVAAQGIGQLFLMTVFAYARGTELAGDIARKRGCRTFTVVMVCL